MISKSELALPCLLHAATASLLLSSGAMATTYYVDSVTGSESNPGTLALPWKNIGAGSKVNTVLFQPGDTILFKRGSSWTGFIQPARCGGTEGNPITFDAYGTGAKPVIDGGGLTGQEKGAVIIWNPRNFIFRNFSISNMATGDAIRNGIVLNYHSGSVPPVGTPPEEADGSTRVYRNVSITDNDIHDVRGWTVRDGGLQNYNNAALLVRYVGSATYPVRAENLTVENNTFYDNKCIGFYIKPGGYYASRGDLWTTGLVVRSNTFNRGGADHIIIQGADAPLIEYNSGYDAGLLATQPSAAYIAGMWTNFFTKNTLFQFNEVARTCTDFVNGLGGDGQAFDVDYGTIDSHTFQYNYTHDNEGGILIMMPPQKNPSTGLPYAPVYKKVIYRYNLSVNDSRNTGTGCQFAVEPSYPTNSAHVYNNVLYTTRGEGFRFRDIPGTFYSNNIIHTPSAVYPSKPVFSNNCYFGHTPEVTDHRKLIADPLFVGPIPATAGDGYTAANANPFMIQDISPCVNAGEPIADNGGEDFWGNPLYAGGAADIGMHEVVGGNRPAPGAAIITDDRQGGPVVYTGTWHENATAEDKHYNSTRTYSTTNGNSVEFTFTGTNVAIYGVRGPGHGRLNVSIDNGPSVSVECYRPYPNTVAADYLYRTKLYQISGLSNTTHTIKATTAQQSPLSSYGTIEIDYFLQVPGTPLSDPSFTVADITASSVTYYPTAWTVNTTNDKNFGNTYATSSNPTDYLEYTFTGTGVRLRGVRGGNFGKVDISIDGGPVTQVNCYQPTSNDYMVNLFEQAGLPFGLHTIRVAVAAKDPASGSNAVWLDCFEVLNGGILPSADAMVRNGVHANTNFGAAATFDVKLDSTDFQREAFIKFPVTGYASASKATLFLVPTFNGTDTAVTYNVELVTNDAWTETGITWNNKPAGSGTVLGTFTGASLSTFTPVTLDLTNEVKAQAAADGTLSLRIRSTNTGIAKWVNFGSRENVTPSFRPQLVTRP